jgi:glycogen synthase
MEWPNVITHTEWMTLEEEVDLVTSCDLFVSASRGEGFGLMPLQAISAGIPTVLTDMTGHREFSDLATHRITGTLGLSRITNWETIGRWFEPNKDELADAIKDVYYNRDRAKKLALRNAPDTAAFNWATAAEQFLQIVKPSDRRVDPARVPSGEILVPVRVKRAVIADIGRYHVHLVPGHLHHVFLNVRDVLAESGHLLEE